MHKKQWLTMQAIHTAQLLYARHHTLGRIRAMLQTLVRQQSTLLNIADTSPAWSHTPLHDPPVQAVAIQQIVGSTRRPTDFGSNFAPLKRTDKKRWQKLAVALQLGEELPPVKLIKLGTAYYVQDGHLRISVARASGYDYVDAIVHEVEVTQQVSAYQARGVPEYVCPQCTA